LVQIARVPGSAAGGRCENGWRRRRLRCATQTDGAACRRERSAARPRRVRAVARFAIDELTGRDSYEARRAEPAPKAAFKKVKGRSPVARRRVPCSRASLQQGSTGRSSPSNDRGYARRGEREGWGGLGGGDSAPPSRVKHTWQGYSGGWVGVRVRPPKNLADTFLHIGASSRPSPWLVLWPSVPDTHVINALRRFRAASTFCCLRRAALRTSRVRSTRR